MKVGGGVHLIGYSSTSYWPM